MSELVKVELVLDGVSCASCASKIESSVNNIEGVRNAVVNFSTQVMNVEVNADLVDDTISKTKAIVNKIEPHVTVIIKDVKTLTINKLLKKYNLENLGCANCAAKIETEIKKLEYVKNVSVNFATKEMKVEFAKLENYEMYESEMINIINKIESDVIVTEVQKSHSLKKVINLVGLSCSSCATKIENKVKQIEGVSSAFIIMYTQG